MPEIKHFAYRELFTTAQNRKSYVLFCIFASLILALRSYPISKIRAFKYIHNIKTIKIPKEPYSLLYDAKLFT